MHVMPHALLQVGHTQGLNEILEDVTIVNQLPALEGCGERPIDRGGGSGMNVNCRRTRRRRCHAARSSSTQGLLITATAAAAAWPGARAGAGRLRDEESIMLSHLEACALLPIR